MPVRKRTITTTEEISEAEPPRAEVRLQIGKVTVATVLAMARKIEKAAGGANAPTDAEVRFDSYGGSADAEVRISWEMEG